MKNKLVVLFLIGITLAPLKCNAVVYYDDAKSYFVNSDEIVSTLNKFKFEQSNLNSTIVGGKVIDLVIFAGQSNMVGKSIKDDVLFEVPNRSGFELRFNSDNKAVGVKYLKDSIDLDTSLIPAFANAYYNNTGVPIVAVQAAISGSKIEDWQKGKKYYNIMKSKLTSAITYIKEKKESFNLRNIYFVWYQGENDNPNLAYEKNLERLFKETKKLGVKQNFMIRIGHLYRVDDKKGSNKQKNNFNKYSDMIDLQTKFSRRSEDVVLVSTSASLLSQVKGPSSSNPFGLPKISDFMIDQVHFSQLGLNIIGSEAGYNTAIYNNTGKEADVLDYEYKTGNDDFYYTGYDDSKSLTDKQSNYFYKKARKFVRDGNARGILQYGVLSKYKAYDLRTVYYGSEKYNGLKVIYMDKFKKGHYLGFDCSGFSSFIYHYVFGLAFDDNGKPWSTGKYIDLPVVKKYGTNYLIPLFKTVGELKSDKKEYTLYSAKKKFKLQTGDMIIGRNSNNDAHIVIYIGKVKNNKKDLVLNSTSVAKHNIKSGSKRYNIDFAYLTEDNFAGAKNFSHEYKNITVLRLNNGVLPNNFIGNSYEVDFSKLNSKNGSYKFLPKVTDGEITEFSWINSYN